jgi:catechol 2,3-dioxygenase-like lactoylglutathione lyase family enzyme
MDISYQSCILFVRDIAASRRFYEVLLGQQVELDHGSSIVYKSGPALWHVDHAFETIYGRPPDTAVRLGGENCELHFETADIQAASARLVEANVEFVHPMREMPWGKRILRFRDPDGHIVALGEPMPAVIARLLGEGLSIEAVAERTAMPTTLIAEIAGGWQNKGDCGDSN